MSDGKTLYTIRYGENVEEVNTQFYSADSRCLEDFASDCTPLPEGSTLVVSEPLDKLSNKWHEVPENSLVTIRNNAVSIDALIEK